ncbi:MAG: hypothetical protein KGL67_02115 [Patescibacteria group bacterium]|nr:hypothetical protein [Patescibacteria group bacterium]
MRWSDSWLSKRDCNHDYRLDRGGDGGLTDMSKGWLTNQVEGEYVGSDGKSHRYRYFVKIVYDGGTACKAGTPTCLWSLYAITKEVKNDPFGEFKYIDKNKLGNPARLRN